MKYFLIKISILILLFSLLLSSCHRKIGQNSMFTGRSHKVKKTGIYDAGTKGKKPVSLQIKKEYDKLSKNDTNPKKAKRRQEKEIAKKKKASAKARAKNNKKRHVKTKTTKGKTGGQN